jgi:hypothetical protein
MLESAARAPSLEAAVADAVVRRPLRSFIVAGTSGIERVPTLGRDRVVTGVKAVS